MGGVSKEPAIVAARLLRTMARTRPRLSAFAIAPTGCPRGRRLVTAACTRLQPASRAFEAASLAPRAMVRQALVGLDDDESREKSHELSRRLGVGRCVIDHPLGNG